MEWNGRSYDPTDYASGDAVNQALSTANSCLYGIVHSVIVSMGCSPGLGFVHTGHERSFVYDVADLYKTEITIPIAFRIAASGCGSIGSATRRAVRDAVFTSHLLERCAHDVRHLLIGDEEEEPESDELHLWDNKEGSIPGGVSYSDDR